MDDNSCPSVWKTVGDEIVFCCRLRDTEHLRVCIAAFVASLKQYGAHLEQLKHNLDVKASGWVAAFPVPNVTVPIAGRGNDEEFDELTGERVETDADNSPHEFDFLGKHIDAGFRIAQFARADQFAVSLELAWLISANFRDNFPFLYLGRRELKGVLSGKAYPVVALLCERNDGRRLLLDKEADLTSTHRVLKPHQLQDYLNSFMEHEEVEFPYLPVGAGAIGPMTRTPSYEQFREIWESERIEQAKRKANEEGAFRASDDDGERTMPEEVGQQLDNLTASAAATATSSSLIPQ